MPDLDPDPHAGDPGAATDASPSYAKPIAIGILLLLIVIFAAQNSHDTRVRFLFVDATPRVVILIVVSALMGFAAGLIVGRPVGRRRKDERKKRRSS